MEAYLSGAVPLPPVCSALGIRLVSGANGEGEAHYDADGRHANPMGNLQGGILCALADVAMGMAMASVMEADESFATLEIKINYLRPITNAKLRSTGRVVNRGKSTALLTCDIHDEKDRHIASVTSTVMIFAGEMAKGR